MQPLVLISNDDGFGSPHLTAMADALEADAEVWVVAPERQRSAASHAITLHKPLRLTEYGARRFALSGTPVDCVYVGCLRVAPRPPTLVVSGMNDGWNLGTDVFYSGTVAAAVEGALRGAVGLALSLPPRATASCVERAVGFTRALVRAAIDGALAPGTVLNVNFPVAATPHYRWTCLGRRRYDDDVAERVDPRGRRYYWVGGGPTGHDPIAGSDCVALEAGEISVTPMHLGWTDRALIATPPFAVAGFEAR